MAFQEYFMKERRENWKDCVVASNQYLRLGDSFWSGPLGKCERVRLFFDPNTNEIGILPCSGEKGTGLKIQQIKEKNPMIRWVGFVKRFSLFFDSPQICLVKNGAEVKGEKMKVIVLTNKNVGKESESEE